MPQLLEVVHPAPGFRAVVTLKKDLDDLPKAGAYLPTQRGMDVLHDVARQLEPTATARARLITGTYGTGKSHLALLMANLYLGHGADDRLQPLWERLRGSQWAGRAAELEKAARSLDRPYLVVLVEGPQPDFDGALLRHLEHALQAAGVTDHMPATYYRAAVERLQQLLSDQAASERLRQSLDRAGVADVQALRAQLEEASPAAYEQFQALHRLVCFGANFDPSAATQADEVYAEVAGKLRQAGTHSGIVVLWDEFGRMMELVAGEPSGKIGAGVQRFAESCGRAETGLHLYLVCHRSLDSYVALAGESRRLPGAQRQLWEEEWQKVSGRFQVWHLESKPNELFSLIDQVLVQRGEAWTVLTADHRPEFDDLTEQAHRLELFPDFRYADLRRVVVEGSYPLHPLTACLLPAVSEIVAQNERTLFTFLCDDFPHTVGEFLRAQPVPGPTDVLPLVRPDMVWDYFEPQIQGDRLGQRVHSVYRQAAAKVETRGDLTVALLKLLALVELVREGKPGAPGVPEPTLETLAFGLTGPGVTAEFVRAELDDLGRHGPQRVVMKTHDEQYYLIPSGGADVEERLEELVAERAGQLSLGRFVQHAWQDWGDLNMMSEVEGVAREAGYAIPRRAKVLPVTPRELDAPDVWLRNLEGGEYWDGVVFVALAETGAEAAACRRTALSHATNPQVGLLVPSEPLVGLSAIVARLDALEHLARSEPEAWGESGKRRDEWKRLFDQEVSALAQCLAPVAVQAGSRLRSTWFWRGDGTAVTNLSEVQARVGGMMQESFPLTPGIRHQVAEKRQRGQDGLRAARGAIIDKLLQPNAAALLTQGPSQAERTLIEAVLVSTGVLRRTPKPKLSAPKDEEDAGMAAVWARMEAFREQSRDAPVALASLVGALQAPPFGIGTRVMPMLFAAALRDDLRLGNIALLHRRKTGQTDLMQVSGEMLEAAFKAPSDHLVQYIDLTKTQTDVLRGLCAALTGRRAPELDGQPLFQAVKDAATDWWDDLPGHARETRQRLSEEAAFLRGIVSQLVPSDADPQAVLAELLKSLATRQISVAEALERFGGWLGEIRQTVEELPGVVAGAAQEELGLPGKGTPEGVHRALSEWYRGLPEPNRQTHHVGDAGKLVRTLGESPDGFLPTLAEAVLGKRLEDFSDQDSVGFCARLKAAKEQIEEPPPDDGGGGRDGPEPPDSRAALIQIRSPGEPLLQKSFAMHRQEDLGEQAKLLLQLISVNSKTMGSAMKDGELETVLLLVLREVFGHG